MDIAMKLEFDDCDENVDMNASMLTINSDCDNEQANHAINNSSCYDTMRDDMDNSFSYNVGNSPDGLFSPRKDSKSHFSNSNSPPYKRIRALRLFDTPATPKTLLQKCAADSTSASKPIQIRTRSRTANDNWKKPIENTEKEGNNLDNVSKTSQNSNSKCNSNNIPVANINPFTPSSMMLGLSRKRARSSRELNKSANSSSDIPFTLDTTTESPFAFPPSDTPEQIHNNPAEEYYADEDSDELSRQSLRLSIHEANVSRYHEEFLEMCLVGRGQFGSVYKCRHRLDGCVYAIKKSLKPVAGSATERIALNEVYAHAVLGKHPHVVRYYSAWAENDHMIIQNEFCTSGSLADTLEENKKTQQGFSEVQLKQILLHVAKGLKYIHHQQLVHMDMKPGNIFVSREPQFSSQGDDSTDDDGFEEDNENDESEEVFYKIGDLGHVTSVLNPQVEEGDCRYLPKEILHEDFSQLQKADIFALGLTLYECATGSDLPLNGDAWHSLRDGDYPDIPSLSPDLQILLRMMIHPDPRERPTSSQLVQQLSYCHPVNKSHAQLRRELNAEKLKNEILSRQLQEAAKCLQSISPNVTSSSLTAAVVNGVLAGVAPSSVQSKSSLSRVHELRSGPMTRYANSRVIGKKVNRSVSATNF